jgi:hypothetical protein
MAINNIALDNTGNLSTGDLNTGGRNTGDLNTGRDWNAGGWDTGGWNTGDRHAGYCNTTEPTVRMFNKDTGLKFGEINFPNYWFFNLFEWIEAKDMTEEEKKDHKEYKTTGGYLKVYSYKEAWQKSWDNATEEDRAKTFSLPNFDAEIFYEISGIDLRKKDETIKIGDFEFSKAEVEERLKGLVPVK